MEAIRDIEGGQAGTGLVTTLPTQLIVRGGRISGQQHGCCSILHTEQGYDELKAIRDREDSHDVGISDTITINEDTALKYLV